ncbi:MAG: DUF58 domain-containing protein [Candidatus Omnitrophota bacterium]
MLPKDIIKKIRRIEITTNRLVTDMFAGQYHSVFKGRGMEFDEVREYQIGDDIRTIDWNVTARTGRAHIKKYVEERELTVMVLVDCSLSTHFSTAGQLKSQLAAEIAALLAFSAIRNNDKVGAIFFTDRIEKFIPPRKGSRHVLRLVREVLCFKPKGKGTDIRGALEFLSRVTAHRSVAFIISDFFEKEGASKEPSYKKELSIASRRHDLIAVSLSDPSEDRLHHSAMLFLEDAESGEIMPVDPRDKEFSRIYSRSASDRFRERARLFKSFNIDEIRISTGSSYTDEIVRFFMERRKRK